MNISLLTGLIFFIMSCNQDPKSKTQNAGPILHKKDLTRRILLTAENDRWDFDKVIGQTVYFKNQKFFKTNISALKYIGQLTARHKAPYLILSGRNCESCDENLSIFICSPSDGPMKSEAQQSRYSYPGKEFDYISNKLLFESKMFYGACSLENGECALWLQRTLNDNGDLVYTTLMIRVVKDTLQETVKKSSSLIFNEVSKNCKELPGIDMKSEP